MGVAAISPSVSDTSVESALYSAIKYYKMSKLEKKKLNQLMLT